MAKYFPITKTRTIVVEVPVGDTGEVNRETIRYDLPEIVQQQTVRDAIITAASEQLGNLTEEVVAALLARAEEEVPLIMDLPILTVAPVPDFVPNQIDSQQLIAQRSEEVPTINDDIEALIAVLNEVAPVQEEVVRITAGVNANETVPDLQEDVAAAIVVSPELVPTVDDMLQLELTVAEISDAPIEDVNIVVTATASETLPDLDDQTEAAIVVREETVPSQTEEIIINATLNGYANQNVSNTGWTNQANILGNTTNTSASLTATSSGLLGTTNNTTNGTTVLGFRDVNLGDLTITSVTLQVENSGAGAGVAIQQPTANIQYQYSLNNGSTWTTFYTHNTATLAKGVRTVDITGIVGQDQSLLSALQIRATGSVTSGTGVGAAYTASFFRAWMTVLANRTYT